VLKLLSDCNRHAPPIDATVTMMDARRSASKDCGGSTRRGDGSIGGVAVSRTPWDDRASLAPSVSSAWTLSYGGASSIAALGAGTRRVPRGTRRACRVSTTFKTTGTHDRVT